MLTELKLANFRIFDDEVTVRFRPITVFIGRNSSGKSTIIKFLLMLQQSLGSGKSQFLSPEGERVNLGTFSELRNCLSEKTSLTFELAVNRLYEPPPYMLLEHFGPSDNTKHDKLLYKTNVSAQYSEKANIGHVNYSLVDKNLNDNVTQTDSRNFDDFTFLDDLSAYDMRTELKNIFETPEHQQKLNTTGATLDDLIKQLSEFGYQPLRNYMMARELLDVLRFEVNSLRHLSPVRSEPQRVIVATYPSIDDVGQTGQYTLPHLQQIVSSDREKYEFILPHLNGVAGLESVNFKTTSGYVSQALAKNKLTGADVLIADYGFGVSQCLPVLVQGAIMPRRATLMVEQPEAQLHPTAQLELGSFFADLWQQRQVGSIIETHSDNILLRLRRLIAKADLSNEDVSVAFFTVDEGKRNMPIIKNLDINEDGSMQPGLPMEFFGADIAEGLKLGARK